MPQPSPSRTRSDRFEPDTRRSLLGPARGERWGCWIAAVAVALALGWATLVRPALPDPSRYSPGQVAQVHAAWNAECSACHTPHSSFEVEADATLGVRGRWRDFTCDKCHGGAAHVPDTPLTQQECADCHRDHGGSGHSLTSLKDDACTRCHADLEATHPTRELSVAARVRDFGSHPEFSKLDAGHPGRVPHVRKLKFSHSLHMAPGLSPVKIPKGQKKAKDEKNAKAQLKLKDVDLLVREQFRRRKVDGSMQTNDDPVKLDCASCHRLDSERTGKGILTKQDRGRLGDLPAEAMLPVRAAGHYMLPISYDLHCKACHPLRNVVGDGRGSGYTLDPPHRVQPDAMRGWLTRELTSQMALQRAQMQKDKQLGGRLDPRERREIEEAAAGSWLDLATRNLFRPTGVCARCHVISPAPPQIEPANIPTVWFEKAWFSHTAHRAVDCAQCHPGKEPQWENGRNKVVEREPLGIEGVKSCRQCHLPTAQGGAGVRHGCTDCHRYHNGGNPLQGVGAKARDPLPRKKEDGKMRRWSVEEWVRGGR